jgi:hypothetical protein
VLEKAFPRAGKPADVPQEARAAFEELVRRRLLRQWQQNGIVGSEPFKPMRGMLRLIPSGVGQLQFEQQSIALVLMRLFDT